MGATFLTPGSLLQNRYLIGNKIGSGGFGAVYKAEDTHFQNRVVAIKELRYDSVKPEDRLAAMNAFDREAAVLADPQLRNAHLPAIFDRFPEDGRSYLVMAFIDGETLEDHLSRLCNKKLPFEKAASYILQLCDVLNALHTHNPPIVFRDIKPANIMRIHGDDFLFLIDFGIAREFKPGQAKDTQRFGSPGYAAPEQYGRGQSTPRTDIFGLGALFHQLLTGCDPTDTDLPFVFVPVKSLIDVPDELSTFISRMLEIEPDRRPESILVVKATVQRLLADYKANNNRFHISALPPLPEPPSSVPLPAFVSIAPSGPFEHPCEIECVSWSPDDLYIATRGADGCVRLWGAKDGYLHATYQVSSTRPEKPRSANIVWSPKGKYIATSHETETGIQVWEVARGELTCLYDQHTDNVHAISWSPDGKWIASGGEGHTIHLWKPLTGEVTAQLPVALEPEEVGVVEHIAWSPDATRLATDGRIISTGVLRKEKGPVISVWNLASQKIITSFRHQGGGIATLTWSPDTMRIASADTTYKQHVHVWDTTYGITESKFDAKGQAQSLRWRGLYLFAATIEGEVRVWWVDNKRKWSEFQIFKTPRPIVEWSSGGTSLAFPTQDGRGLKRYDFLQTQ